MGKMMRKKEDPLHWYKFLVIAAIELLLAFSSFGYIIIKPLAITMMPIPVIIGAFLFGSCYSIGAVALPLLTKYFFGIDNYARVFPKISFASNLGAAISLSMVGYIYDFFGSYLYAFIIALAMIAVCVITLTLTAKTKE
jgi:uncharacterized membrane protein